MSQGKTKLLALVHGEYASHTVKAIEICKALREKGGYEILFSGIGPCMNSVQENGFDHVQTPTLPKKRIDDVLERKFVPQVFSEEDAAYYYGVERRLVQENGPDIILRDQFRDLAGIVAKQNGIFDAYLQLSSCCPYYHINFKPKNLPSVLKVVPKKLLRMAANKIHESCRRKVYKPILDQARAARIPMNPDVAEGFEADLVLLTDDPLFFPFENLRPNYKYTGAILSFEKTQIPHWQQEFIADKRKKIIVTSGSTGVHDKPETFIDAFKDNKYAVALYSNKGCFPDYFYGGGTFDLQSILPYADAFITHGGIGSTYLGLKNKVPMLVLPCHFEQQVNGKQLEKLGAGISLYPQDINPQNIHDNLEKILCNSSFNARAADFSEKMIRNSVEQTVNYIEKGYEEFKSGSN